MSLGRDIGRVDWKHVPSGNELNAAVLPAQEQPSSFIKALKASFQLAIGEQNSHRLADPEGAGKPGGAS
jgi:hypothetical protein